VEVFALGLPLSILYYLARLRDADKKAFIVQSVVLLAAGASATGLAVFLGADLIAGAFGNPDLAALLRLFAVYPVLIAPSLAVEGVLIVSGRVLQFAVFAIASRLAVLGAGVVTVAAGGTLTHLFALILAAGVIEIAVAGMLLRGAVKTFEATPRPGQLSRRPTIREQFAIALPTGLSNMVGILNQELDKLIIAGAFSLSQFARYANGALEIPILGTIVSSVSTVLMPEFTRRYNEGDHAGVLNLWHESVCKVALLQFPLLIFFGLFASEFIVLLFSDTYRDSAVIFQIYVVATVPKLTWYGTLLVAIGRTRAPLWGSIIALTTNVILNLLFIRWIGFTGPAIATTLAAYGTTVFDLSRIRTALGVGWLGVFPWRRLALILLVGSLATPLFVLLGRYTSMPDWLHLVIAGSAYGVVVLVCYLRLGLTSWTEVRLALQQMHPAHRARSDEGVD
jgi:O-antigen/teichoic acid export membrane protein